MKPITKSMIWSIRKKKTSTQCSKKKKESQKLRYIRASGTTSSVLTFASGVPEGEEKEQ